MVRQRVGVHHRRPRGSLRLGGGPGRAGGSGPLLAGRGAVTGKFVLDLGDSVHAPRNQLDEQGPAQFGVEGEPVDDIGALEDGADPADLVGSFRVGEGGRVDQLQVAAGCGGAQQRLGPRGHVPKRGRPVRGVTIGVDRELSLGQQ